MSWDGKWSWGARAGSVGFEPSELGGDNSGSMDANKKVIRAWGGDWDVGFIEKFFAVVKANCLHCFFLTGACCQQLRDLKL
jgi:hypothetical protein